jgi:PAS domain S-box-containing protein/putative nucleotidyltransferase with HDIG domain
MKSKLAFIVILSGWLFLIAYIYYDYTGIEHFISPLYSAGLFPRFLAAIVLICTNLTGYLINERKRVLGVTETLERKYYDLYENAPDGYHSIDSDGIIIEANNTWLKMFGYAKDEVIGKLKLIELLTDEDLKTYQNTFSELKRTGSIKNLEYDLKRKDGILLPVLINSTAVFDKKGDFLKGRSIVRDNSIKKDYEKKLLRTSDEWRATFDSMPYGVLLIDREFNIIRANKYISKIAGIPVKDLSGKKCYEVIHGKDRPIEGCPFTRSGSVHSAECFEWHEPRLNKYFMLHSTLILDEKGLIKVYAHSMVDITELKDKEEKLIKSRDAFLNMLRDLDFSYKELKTLYEGLIYSFVNAIDAKSPWTKGHSERVTNYSLAIAKEMKLKDKDIDTLRTAALLHDIGKIGTYDVILDKPGKLTAEEFALVKMHPAKGEKILKPIRQLQGILPIIRSHHERIDGKGYPDGLKDDKIPFLSKILSVADSFDSMTSERPYRPTPGKEYAMSELKKYSGVQFDPHVVEAFLRVLER